MATVNDVYQLVNKKGGSYAAIAPKLEPRKFNKWKKRMLCYLVRMEPYYLKCIKDGTFQLKIVDGDAKPEDYGMPIIVRLLTLQISTEVAETFDWDEEEVSNEEEVTQVKVLMALVDDELTVGNNYARNSEWVDITIRKRHIREPIWYMDSGCSRSMTGVKSYLHKYVEQPVFTKVALVNGLKYNLISISQLCDAKYIVQFDDKQGTIFNANKEIVLIAPRRNDVYVLDMSSLTPNGACFFAKASESVNWLWHKRLSDLNFKNINKLAKQNKVLGIPSIVYSKDKPCTACEKGKHHRASFKTKQNFSIRKCLHLLHMDLFRPVSPMSINHEKYTLVIVDEYSRYTWVHFLKKKSQAPEIIMSFIRMKGISQNFTSPYTPKQNGVSERKNRTLIEAARTMLNGSVFSKHFWTEAARIACYTQNRLIIVKRNDKTPYEIFRERIPDISYFYVFGCLVFIHNHKDHLSKFDAKADDGYFLGYSFVLKAFRVFNTRRQQVEETYHITFDESMETIRFTNTLVDEIGINDSSTYPSVEFHQEDDPSRQYQVDSDISYYIIPHGRSLTELTQENHVPKVIAPNEPIYLTLRH
ncbi:retrovirus-related pol polyprotein from transposon TNT 1-94 [Tanacetum coccineum]